MGQADTPAKRQPKDPPAQADLLGDIRALIESARGQVAQTVNAGLVMLNWSIGRRIRQDILKSQRAGYGEQLVLRLSARLVQEYGGGFSRPALFRMIRFAEVFPDLKIVSTLLRQLGWSHFIQIIPLKDPVQRDFYAEMCRLERWSTRTLHKKIGGMLYERTALSRKPAQLAAIELKLEAFKPEFKGQMELYLRWLEKHETQPGEEPPIGLILCAGQEQEEIELLELDKSGIRVAQYMTELPPAKILGRKLRESIRSAREKAVRMLSQDGAASP
jgi:hypothetical protein